LPIIIHPLLKEISRLFQSSGKQVYLVGGAVRDMLRKTKNHDWDLATDAQPAEVSSIFASVKGYAKVIPTGIKHGTVTVLYRGHNMEITTFRTETGYSDGRRPDAVNYAATIEEDLSRRDFTMNAIALRLPCSTIIDPFGGVKDIKAKIIRCVGDARARFAEDGLRPLRAVRFAAQLAFRLDPDTLGAISGALAVSAKVSPERVRDELNKILASPAPSTAFLLMEKTGLLRLFLGELAACRGVEQKGFHSFDVLDHCLLALDYAAKNEYPLELRLAALLHDIGKPAARKTGENGIFTFYRHEEISAAQSREILQRLRYPNAVIDAVCHLVKEHMFHYTEDWNDGAVRRFIARVGENNLQSLYRLRRADAYAMAARENYPAFLVQLAQRVEEVLAKSNVLSLKDLAVSGTDLMGIGIKPGKAMGAILSQLLETVLNDPQENTREKLLLIAGKIAENQRR